MSDNATCNWKGASGTSYTYHIYSLPPSFKDGQDGNYIFAKKNELGIWVPIYIGQGDLKSRSDSHHQEKCIKQKGATHFHAHPNLREADRLTEEKDLLANYLIAYAPNGCNEKIGG